MTCPRHVDLTYLELPGRKVYDLDLVDFPFHARDELAMSGIAFNIVLPVVVIFELGDEAVRNSVLSWFFISYSFSTWERDGRRTW